MNTVVNPRGQFPALQQAPMALRLDSLTKKTIYIVDVRWPYTHQFADEMCNVLSQRHPDTKFVIREKAGSYMVDDPTLWAEIQEQGNAAILTVGH
jgi:hypothetical protein